MTAEEYFAYVCDYQKCLAEACLLTRAGLADPTPEEVEEMETLSTEEDPFEEQTFLLTLICEEMPLVIWDEDENAECPSSEEEVNDFFSASGIDPAATCWRGQWEERTPLT